jgi:hypothetical protein
MRNGMELVVMVEKRKLVLRVVLVGRGEVREKGLRRKWRIYRAALSAFGEDKR